MHTTTVGAKTRAEISAVRPGREGIRIARTMTVTSRASRTWRIWPSSRTVMKERKTPASGEADGVERAQGLEREPGPAGDQPDHRHGQAGADVAQGHRAADHGERVGAADRVRLARRKSQNPNDTRKRVLASRARRSRTKPVAAGAVEAALEEGRHRGKPSARPPSTVMKPPVVNRNRSPASSTARSATASAGIRPTPIRFRFR